jgi:CubicO group peptidase (beta-lactamase class C family)
MKLYESGAFQLDDSLSKYAPEFANMQVCTGQDSLGNLILVPLDRPISIRDLTRHTAGFRNANNIPALEELIQKVDPMNYKNTLTQMAEKLGSIPLSFQPGTRWFYSDAVDVQAFLVERISGVPYGQFVRENVLDPLGMSETRYFVPESDRSRMAATYFKSEDSLARIPDESINAFNYGEWPLTPGGHGLTSTVDDYMKFAQMLVNEGTFNGVQILKPETIKLMATNHLPDSIIGENRSWLVGKGRVGFGIDFAVRTALAQSPNENVGAVGEFFWDGAASTLFWVDPENELVAILFVQLFPFDKVGLHKGFRDAIYGKYQGD